MRRTFMTIAAGSAVLLLSACDNRGSQDATGESTETTTDAYPTAEATDVGGGMATDAGAGATVSGMEEPTGISTGAATGAAQPGSSSTTPAGSGQ